MRTEGEQPGERMGTGTAAMMGDEGGMMGTGTPAMMDDHGEEMAGTGTPGARDDQGGEMMGTSEAGMGSMPAPAYRSAVLTDAVTGKEFSLQDFKGKVILVETMAVWCTTCFQQQTEIKALHTQLDASTGLITISLDIDPNENVEDLKGYVTRSGFDWPYAVAPQAVAREIGQLYGQQFLNPPSAPMFIIDRKGEVHTLPFGVKSAAGLQKALEPFLKESM